MRFKNENASARLARIDKISLLTPRADLAAPVGVAGITYLNVPATQLGGPTVAANVTITSASVYDEYLDLAGTVSYNNQTYPFNLSGDVYRSMLGTPSDKVGRLSDLTNTFDVLYFAVRKPFLASSADIIQIQNSLRVNLQRRNTRELVIVEIPLAGQLGSVLTTLFNLEGQHNTPYTSDYWVNNLFEPSIYLTGIASSMTAFVSYDPYRTVIYTITYKRPPPDISDKQRCTIAETISFGVAARRDFDTDVGIGGGVGIFGSALVLNATDTRGINASTSEDWTNYCHIKYDSETSELTIGSDGKKSSGYWIRTVAIANAGTSNGDFLSYGTFSSTGSQNKILQPNIDIPTILLIIGKALFKTDLITRVVSTVIEVILYEFSQATVASKEPIREYQSYQYLHIINPGTVGASSDPNHKTLYSEFTFFGIYLDQPNQQVNVSYTINSWYGTTKGPNTFRMYWIIPILSIESGRVFNYTYMHTLPYNTGPVQQ